MVSALVEGHGEVTALPVLVGRIARALRPDVTVDLRPIRVQRDRLLKAGELERAVELAVRRAGPSKAVVIVIDADDDCPAQLGPAIAKRALAARADARIGVCLANREFEAWFLAAAPSLAGCQGLPASLEAPADPEGVRGAKEWLSAAMPPGRRYSETVDQQVMARQCDLDLARRASSFDKLWREVDRILGLAVPGS
jgi:hypothetical protein